MKLNDLLSPWARVPIPDCDILGLQNDSRQVKSNDLFIAYPGAAADGRLFIQKACDAGASAIVYEPDQWPDTAFIPEMIPCIPVPGLARLLAGIASRFYGHPSHHLSVTGVTGTNGKTTIAYQLAQAYGLLGKEAAYIGTLGQGRVNQLQALHNTTPDALCLQRFLHDYQQQGIQQVCMEVSSHALSQQRVDEIEFTEAIYTNLSHEHLDYHHTMDAYADAKAQLFAMPLLKHAIVNHDDAYSSVMLKNLPKTCRKLSYGMQAGSDVRVLHYETGMAGSHLRIDSPWGQHDVRVGLLGTFNMYNSLAVLTSLLAQGFPPARVLPVMEQILAAPGRMEVVLQKPCVIVDYAHTPDALENVLSTLGHLKKGRLGVVFGCGGDRDKTKRPIMGQIASQYADFVIVTSDNPRTEDPLTIINEVAAGLSATAQAMKIIDRQAAIHQALDMADDKDIILIAGKGHESYQEIATVRYPFSDQEIVRKYHPY
jgi:UDP-N-acetylmuramoyl-L-alanyl-D-glutamate--2,6-diaminopimelate ligase